MGVVVVVVAVAVVVVVVVVGAAAVVGVAVGDRATSGVDPSQTRYVCLFCLVV